MSEHDDDIISGTAEEHAQEHAQGHPPKRRLTVLAVAAAVLLAGGGGAYWAVTAGGGSSAPRAAAATRSTGSDRADGAAPAQPSAGGTYRLTGTLPKDGPRQAALYRPSGEVGQAAVRQLAALLGLTGPVVGDQGSWRVGPADGSGPALLVGKAAPGTWSYARGGQPSAGARPAEPPTGPEVPPPAGSGADGSGTASHSAAGDDGGAPPVSEQRAKAAAAPVLSGLGLSDAKVGARQTVASTRLVTADPVVGGLPTHGWGTSLEIGPDGAVSSGYGRLSPLAEGKTYPVDGAQQAFRELSGGGKVHPDVRMYCLGPVPDGAKNGTDGGAKDAPGAAPASPGQDTPGAAPTSPGKDTPPTSPGQDKTLPSALPCGAPHPAPTVIRGAVFGLAAEFVPGGQALVPAWLFDALPAGAADATTVAQQAVDPSLLQGTTEPGGPGSAAPASPAPASPAPPSTPAGPPASPRTDDVKVTGYRQQGGTLVLSFYGGVCETYTATASETAAQVRVTVVGKVKSPQQPCPAILKAQSVTVPLDKPLGGRTVLDTSDGRPVEGG